MLSLVIYIAVTRIWNGRKINFSLSLIKNRAINKYGGEGRAPRISNFGKKKMVKSKFQSPYPGNTAR